MKIKNLTAKSQGLTLIELVGGRGYTISVEPFGTTEITGPYFVDLEKYKGKFEIVSDNIAPITVVSEDEEEVDSKSEILEEVIENEAEESKESSEEAPTTAEEGKFICDECGAEFASLRGLNSHKNRVHSAEN